MRVRSLIASKEEIHSFKCLLEKEFGNKAFVIGEEGID
jgi:hypothetical protein